MKLCGDEGRETIKKKNVGEEEKARENSLISEMRDK